MKALGAGVSLNLAAAAHPVSSEVRLERKGGPGQFTELSAPNS